MAEGGRELGGARARVPGKRTEGLGPAGQSGVGPCAARGSSGEGPSMVPLGGAELPTCRPGARWRGPRGGVVGEGGRGERDSGPADQVDLGLRAPWGPGWRRRKVG